MFFLFSIFLLCYSISFAEVMTGGAYIMESDSINFAGSLSTSTAYSLEDTLGEVATGYSTSTIYNLHSGFMQNPTPYLALSVSTNEIVMSPSLGGLTGGYSNGSVVVNVVTDNIAGYSLYIQAENEPALKSPIDSIADYVPIGADPDYDFTVADTKSVFGFSPFGDDISLKFKNDGASNCNTGSTVTSLKCWEGLSTDQIVISGNTHRNDTSGANTTINFRVGLGNSRVQTNGWYYATTTITAVAL